MTVTMALERVVVTELVVVVTELVVVVTEVVVVKAGLPLIPKRTFLTPTIILCTKHPICRCDSCETMNYVHNSS